jgi:hypothetical protein
MPSSSGRNSRSKSSSRSTNARAKSKSKSSSRGSSSKRSTSSRSRSSASKSASSRSRSGASKSKTAARGSRSSASSRPLTGHEEIQQWAEERGANPACVRGTGGGEDVGMIRLDFPGYSGEQSLEHIEWDDWFQKFDDSGLALLVQDTTARGQKSNFNKLVSRETAGISGKKSSRGSSSAKGRSGASSRKRAA